MMEKCICCPSPMPFISFYKGEVLGITRFGLAKMKESVLMLASVSHLLTLGLSTLWGGGDSNDIGWGGMEYFLSEERGNVFDASSFATLRKPRRIG